MSAAFAREPVIVMDALQSAHRYPLPSSIGIRLPDSLAISTFSNGQRSTSCRPGCRCTQSVPPPERQRFLVDQQASCTWREGLDWFYPVEPHPVRLRVVQIKCKTVILSFVMIVLYHRNPNFITAFVQCINTKDS